VTAFTEVGGDDSVRITTTLNRAYKVGDISFARATAESLASGLAKESTQKRWRCF
jgi:hypothetical protein